MRKIFFFCLLMSCTQIGWAVAYTIPERLQEAADLYFNAQPNQALEKYIELCKDTNHRSAFLNAIFIAMEQNKPQEAVDIALEADRL